MWILCVLKLKPKEVTAKYADRMLNIKLIKSNWKVAKLGGGKNLFEIKLTKLEQKIVTRGNLRNKIKEKTEKKTKNFLCNLR